MRSLDTERFALFGSAAASTDSIIGVGGGGGDGASAATWLLLQEVAWMLRLHVSSMYLCVVLCLKQWCWS